jgi:phage virion morphogenesis protein
MGGTSFKLDWNGLDRMTGNAAHLGTASRQALADIGETLVASTLERFETSTAPDGTPWQPSHRAEKEDGKTLVDTGRLRGSIGYEVGPDSVSVGSNLVYARIHQLGGKAGRGHSVTLPPRPYLGISGADIQEARAILAGTMATLLGAK